MITLAGYRVLEQIHESNHSKVYRAVREVDQLPVILKTLKQDYPTPKELSQYQQEYTLLKNSNITGTTKVYGIEDYQRSLVIIFEDFGGISLKQYLQQLPQQRLPILDFLKYAIAITQILEEIHLKNIIHKDINPANIILNPETETIKIIDFGISSQLTQERTGITTVNLLEGTLAYLSPEQTGRMNRFLDYRTDFYSLGITFYELLTGQLPFITNDSLEVLHFHLAKIPRSPHEILPEIPPIIAEIVMRLLAKMPEFRYQTTFSLLADLQSCLDQLQTIGSIQDFPLQQHDYSSKFEIPQKLYGREEEIRQLNQAVTEAKNGNTKLVLVSGYSGIGKSSLVNEIQQTVLNQKGIFIRGKFEQLQRDIPYLPIISAIRELIFQILNEDEAIIQKWRSQIVNQLGNHVQNILKVIPEIELIVGKQLLTSNAPENIHSFDLSLQKLIQTFSQSETLLTLFLDDLHWADNASLKLIKSLLTSPIKQNFLLIISYRDNEVNQAHPLTAIIKSLQDFKLKIINIQIQNLPLEIVNQIIADTLKTSPKIVLPLGDICYQKTNGNPFFLNQLLLSLYQKKLISFKPESQKWQWDLAQIQTLQISDSVVDLIISKLNNLDSDIQSILSLAATIGNVFDLSTLGLINQGSRQEIAQKLQAAIAEALILPIDNNYKIPLLLENEELHRDLKIQYRFSHDRIQQAAYALLSSTEKQHAHLAIGNSLLEYTSPQDLEQHLFDIVNHLNQALDLIQDEQKLVQLIQLNLLASQRAKNTAAFTSAFKYSQQSISILENYSPKIDEQLRLRLYQNGVDVAYLSLHFEQMDIWVNTALSKSKSLLDEAQICEIQIQAYIAKNQLTEAIETALIILDKFGLKIPHHPTNEDIQQAIANTTAVVKSRTFDELANAPEMQNPQQLAMMRILGNVASAAYISRPELYPIIVLKQVDLSVADGNAANSAYAYATYGLILCATETDIEFGNQMGALALHLLEKFQANFLKAKIFNLVFPFVHVWKRHLKQSLEPLLEGYYSGIDMGDLEFAAYCIYNHCSFNYFSGKPLPIVLEAMKIYGEAIAKIKQNTALNFHNIYWQSALSLVQRHDDLSLLQGEVYDETVMLPLHLAANDQYAMVALNVNKLILNYLFQNYQQAIRSSAEAKKYISATSGYPLYALYFFYDSLAQLAIYSEVTPEEQSKILVQVEQNQTKLQNWAHHAPMNYQHKYDLVAAELARIRGDRWQASELYEQAIAGAKKYEYLQEEALSYELAAKFYRYQGRRKITQTYLKEAHYLYERWGAIAKVEDLEQRYPQFLPRKLSDNALTQTMISSNGTQTNILDLNSIFKASQTLASDLKRETLLGKMMQIIIENAGADKGHLILFRHQKWLIAASASVNTEEPKVYVTEMIDLNDQMLPVSVVNYVICTCKDLVLNHATTAGDFTNDPYICQQQPQSIFCLPLIHQGTMNAVLYLENKLTTDAFTPDRLEILQMLSTQAAISLENANLYETLEEKVSDRTAELTRTLENLKLTQSQLIEAEKMASLGNLVAGVAHEISTPVGTSITISSFLAQETQNFIQACADGQLKRSILNDYLQIAQESSQMLLGNLTRAGELVNSFKQVAVDQTRLEQRTFQIKTYIEEILLSLQPELRHQQHTIQVNGDRQLTITSYPGAISQIITNLLMNSLKHAYPPQQRGILSFNLYQKEQKLCIDYRDDGCGIAPENLPKIFEPFFTTARNQGGTGLGLHIVYNLVNQTLKGQITCHSEVGHGTQFLIELPLSLLDNLPISPV